MAEPDKEQIRREQLESSLSLAEDYLAWLESKYHNLGFIPDGQRPPTSKKTVERYVSSFRDMLIGLSAFKEALFELRVLETPLDEGSLREALLAAKVITVEEEG